MVKNIAKFKIIYSTLMFCKIMTFFITSRIIDKFILYCCAENTNQYQKRFLIYKKKV